MRAARSLGVAVGGAVLLGTSGLLVTAGWFAIFSSFVTHDDEGYVLLSLRNFARPAPLYDQLYTQYGPFYYLLTDALSRALCFAWSSQTGRVFALCCWFGTAASCALCVARRTRSLACSVFTLVITFACLIFNTREPGHPGSLVALMVALAAWLGSEWDTATRARAAGVLGMLGAALALIKINVGGFLLISAASLWLLRSALGRRRVLSSALGTALALLPWLLMRQLLLDPSVLQLAFDTSLAALSVVIAMRSTSVSAAAAAGRPGLVGLCVGAGTITLLTLGAVMLRGTSLSGLLYGVLLGPLAHPLINFTRVAFVQGSAAVAVFALLATVRFVRGRSAGLCYAIAAIRLAAAGWVTFLALREPFELARFCLSYGVAIAALCAVPLRPDPNRLEDARARHWLALVLVLQSLHAYPTAGSQVSWASFLFIPLLGLALPDAWSVLSELRAIPSAWTRVASWMVVAGLLAIPARLLPAARERYAHAEALDLPGAGDLKLPPQRALMLRTLTENARLHAGVLFSAPGMFSFNLWSGKPTPTLANATFWKTLLAPPAQHAIAARLRADPRAVVILHRNFEGVGELAGYLQEDFGRAFELGEYSFLVHRGRRIAKLSTARLKQGTPGELVLELTLAKLSQPISHLDIRASDAPNKTSLFHLSAGTGTLEAAAVGEDGKPLSTDQPLEWPAQLSQPITRLRARFPGRLSTTRPLIVELFSGEQRIQRVSVLK